MASALDLLLAQAFAEMEIGLVQETRKEYQQSLITQVRNFSLEASRAVEATQMSSAKPQIKTVLMPSARNRFSKSDLNRKIF
jgi:hypothetical protein